MSTIHRFYTANSKYFKRLDYKCKKPVPKQLDLPDCDLAREIGCVINILAADWYHYC